MAYSTDADLLLEFSEEELARLTGDATGAEFSEERTAHARLNADAMIDSYLVGRYPVPFTAPIDPIIRKISIDLTIGNLYETAYRNSAFPATVLWRRLNAQRLLKEIQRGEAFLLNYTASSTAPPAILTNNRSGRDFTDELLDLI